MREDQLIAAMVQRFRRSAAQKNAPFAADAEIVEIGDSLWALTVDEFSPEEDLFGDLDPALLGHNLVTAVLSDLYACGAEPSFFMHSMVLPENARADFLEQLTQGISDTLDHAGCYLLGGDLGRAENWRYTGFALGQVRPTKPLMRVLPNREQSLWITGTLGDANLAVAARQPAPLFELRREHARYIRAHATGCIDTSGGLMDALWSLRMVNPTLRFEVDRAALPIDPAVGEFCQASGVPVEVFLFGGAGEYELLFAAEPQAIPDVEATRIATVAPSPTPGLFAGVAGQQVEIDQPPPCPRGYANQQAYIDALLQQVQDVFG